MPGDFIAIDTEGIDEVRRILQRLPAEAQDAVSKDVAEYLLNVLRTYPPYKYVARAKAYHDAPAGHGFFTEKQRRWFFANLDKVTPPYERKQNYRDGWQVVGSGPSRLIANESPAAVHLQDDERQSRMAKLGGWKKLKDVIKERLARIEKIAESAAKRAIKKLDKSAQ